MNEAELWAYLEEHPRSFEANMALGSLLLRSDRARMAIPRGVVAREVGWDHREPWMLLGQCYVQSSIDRPQDAEPCLRKALAMGKDTMVLQDLGVCMKSLGRFDEARGYLREAVELAPDNLWAIEEWARLELDVRDKQAALDVLAKVRWDNKMPLNLVVLEVEIRQSMGATNMQVLAALRSIPDERLTPMSLSAKGRIYDKLNCYEDAWQCWEAGKAQRPRYPREEAQRRIDTRRDFFSRTDLPQADKSDGGQPIFIVGAPRSGTTLVEQMLSQHPDIEAGGELKLMPDMIYLIPKMMNLDGQYPEILSGFTVRDMNHLRDAYLAEATRRGLRKTAWFTDKQLMSLYDIPFIHALFPASPIFYIVRHPLDVVLSQYANQLTHGMWSSQSPEDAATHFKITHELVYNKRLAYDGYIYEDIVKNPEPNIDCMCNKIGVVLDKRMLSPHTNINIPQTASRLQVQEPIHDRSIGRWKNYRQWLGPAIEILRDTCNELGYEI